RPGRQWRAGKSLAGRDVLLDPARQLRPPRGLPDLERTHLPAEAPPDREVHVAGGMRDLGEVMRAVVEHVAQARPEKLRLGMIAGPQPPQPLRRIRELEDLDDAGVGLAASLDV